MNVLLSDPDSSLLAEFEKFLKDMDHSVFTAKSTDDAMDIISSMPLDMVVTDWMPSEKDDSGICAQIRAYASQRYVYIILLTGDNRNGGWTKGLSGGADDCIQKPVVFDASLQARIRVAERVVQLQNEVLRNEEEISKNYFQTIAMFTSVIEIFDEDLGGHCRRVGKLSLMLAKRHPHVSTRDYLLVESAGLLHDIGMIGLPGGILSKKRTERNENERLHYLTHPERGEIILKECEFLRPVSTIVRAHHEQFNGRGFPDGLSEDEIPVAAMIVSGASIYDNFLYRGNVSLEDMPANLQRMRGYQLDPVVVDLLLEINMENIRIEEGRDFHGIGLQDLEAGMVIAKDIRMKTGALAMPGETQLTNYEIEKLNSYYAMGCISYKVCVYKNG